MSISRAKWLKCSFEFTTITNNNVPDKRTSEVEGDDANCMHPTWDTRKRTSLEGRRRIHKENNSYPIEENRNLFVVPLCSRPEHKLSWTESCARYVVLYLNIDRPSYVI